MFLRNKKIFSIILSFILVLGMGIMPGMSFAEENGIITIIHTNDVHARAKEEDGRVIGLAKLGAYVENLKAENPNVLVLDAGDMFQGLPFANIENGKSMIQPVNAVGYDAMTAGNHEFDFGEENLFEIKEAINFPMLGANVIKDGKVVLESNIIKEVAGVKVGIFGITTPETAYKTHPDNVKGYEFGDIVKTSKEQVEKLKEEGADVIIALVHLGLYEGDYTSDLIAKGVEGIDLIIDGHSHTKLENGLEESGTLIVSTGEYLGAVGKVELKLEDNKVVERTAALLGVSDFAEVAPKQDVVDAITAVDEAQKPILDEVVGKTAVDLVGEREIARKGETNLGQLATNAMLELTKADIAITNGGGIRTSIPAGDITVGQMVSVFPFGNTIMVKDIKGSDVVAALEHGVSNYPELLGGFPHVAGITFTLNADKPAGSRISDVKVGGEDLVLDKMYSLATNDFMAAGGDDYTMFKDYPIKAEYNTLMDTLVDYVKAQGTVEGKLEVRMTVVGEVAPEEPVEETPAPAPEPTPEPAPEPTPEPTPEPAPQPESEDIKYVVQPNDWLSKIAIKYNKDWRGLAEYNKLKNPNLIYPNQIILIPQP